MNGTPIHFSEARSLVLETVHTPDPAPRSVRGSEGYVLAGDVTAQVDSPSADVSLRDGYALQAASLNPHGAHRRTEFVVLGAIEAGSRKSFSVSADSAVRIMTGAPLPPGADVVVPMEFAHESREKVQCTHSFKSGAFILNRGADCSTGEPIAHRGEIITPSLAGLLTAAGIHRVPIYPRPFVSLVSTGNEVRLPGEPVHRGELYASNLLTAESWLSRFGFGCLTGVVPDSSLLIAEAVETALTMSDVIVSFGGTGGGSGDFIISVLKDMGWKSVFRQVRMKPGKNTVFGTLGNVAVFCLPGGPSAAEIALLEFVLPCLFKMAGRTDAPLPLRRVTFMDTLDEPEAWSRFLPVALTEQEGELQARLLSYPRNMRTMVAADGLVPVIEGEALPGPGTTVTAQILRQPETR